MMQEDMKTAGAANIEEQETVDPEMRLLTEEETDAVAGGLDVTTVSIETAKRLAKKMRKK